jgi:hypothetical protein
MTSQPIRIPIPISVPSSPIRAEIPLSGPSSPARPDTPRGRRSFSKTTHLISSSLSPPPHTASNQSETFQAHHHLPPATSTLIPKDPILYLPPLLSPLPQHVARIKKDGPSYEEMAEFATRLPDIDPGSLALHQGLHHFKPLRDTYASEAYPDVFNWAELVCPIVYPAGRS